MKTTNFLLLFPILFSALFGYGQDEKLTAKQADKLFKDEQYRNAMPFYEDKLKSEPNNADALYKSGVCYLHRFSKEKALENLIKAFSIDSSVNKHIHYWLGRAYQQNYQFDKAIENYNIYKSSLRKKDQRSTDLRIVIEQSQAAKELIKSPQNYLVKNLGPNINSSFSDHSPVISSDNNYLYFTSRRKEIGNDKEELDGEPFEDVFISKKDLDGNWAIPESIHLNTSGHDATNQLFENDSKLLLYKFTKQGDIYITEKEGDKWSDPKEFANINTKKYESSAFITADGKTVYFATNRYKKGDDLDIYYVTKDEKGNWSKIKELKGKINTKFDEDAPFITPDGKTMYFSSRGHKNMGGFDIFKSVVDENGNWSDPENVGYPINTPDDDVYYYLTSNGRRGYLASYRGEGLGEKDIYEIIPISGVIVKGLITEDKTGKKVDGVNVLFTSTKNTTAPSSASSLTKDGQYDLKVMSYNTYKVAVVKGNDTLKTETFDIPVSDEENKIIVKDIVVPFMGKPEDTITVKAGPVAHRYVFRDVYFDDKKSTLTNEAKHELDITSEILKKNPNAEVTLTGNAPSKNDQKLSVARAKQAKEYLATKGVDTSKIKTATGIKKGLEGRSTSVDVKLNSGIALNLDPSLIPSYSVGSSFILRNIYFVTGKYDLKAEGKAELDTLKNILDDFPNLKIELAGHTDDIGNDVTNQQLSEKRAKAAVDYLIKKGIASDRLTYKGYGESVPYVANDSDFNKQLNRRTEAKITAQ